MPSAVVVRVALAAVLVLTLATTAEAFFWNHLVDHLYEGLTHGVIEPLTKLLLGGSTGIVYNALTHNFLGIRRVVSTAVLQGGSAIISGVFDVVWFIISGIITIIYNIIEKIVTKLWELKTGIVLNGIRLIQSFLFTQTTNALGLSKSFPSAKSGDLNILTLNNIDLDKSRGVRSARPPVRVLRGGRSVDRNDHNLKDDLQSATLHDPMQCLPLVLCAIHADPDDLLSTTEAAFKKTFRPYFAEQLVPDWAERYVRAADTGTATKSSDSCKKEYPSCWYPAHHLRQLIAQAMDAEDTNLPLPQQ